ncbi:S-layer homology domain-containing protein [Evtepia gabavorous]|uniref:S-layer homology domain-containing protein n=1 Tax=Evtepia gabavorous TaxID=2211183 RepID=UPI003AF01765
MKRKLLSVFLSLCMMLTLVPGALAAGTEQPTDPTDSSGETSVTVNDASSLKSALESAAEGATITLGEDFSVEAGPENNFTLSKPVTINGNGHTITRAFNEVSTDGYGDYEAVFVITSAGVTIQNVTLAGLDKGQKDEAGIYISGNGTETSEITISACKFIGAENAAALSGGTGIISSGDSSAYLTVTNCQFTNLKYGMYFNGISQAAITGNQIDGTKYTGIYLEGSNVTIENNVLTNIASENYDNAAYASGIYVGNSSDSSSITINENKITLHENVTHGVPVVNAKVAKVGETEYATIQEALNTIGESSSLTVTLLSDVVLSAPVQVPAGKEITIQGENHTILYPVSVGAAFSGTNGISSNTKLTVNGVNFKISDAAESPATGFAVLVGEGTNGVNIAMNGCSFTNLYAGVYFGHVEAGSTGSISITDSTYHNSRYGYSIDEVTNGSLVGGVTVSFTGNTTNGTAEKEPWNSITVTSGTTTKGYSSWTAAYEAAQASDIITLNMDVATSALTIEKQITLNGNGHTISYNGDASESSPANGALITIQGENANNVTIQNLTVDTQGKVKHGVQFYCVTDGQLEDATVNGGAYTSVIVNGAEVSLTNCTLNPAEGAYANIEYAMGSGVTKKPEISLSNVTGNAEEPLVYADKNTANNFKGNDDSKSYEEILKEINQKVEGATVTLFIQGDTGEEDLTFPGTQLYTITFDTNGHGSESVPNMTTNNYGKLSSLPTLDNDGSYQFIGWYTEKSGGTKVAENETSFNENTTLYAHWNYTGGGGGGGGSVTTKYTLSFDTNGGSAIAKVTKEKGTTVDLGQYVPTREGYTFAGWYSDEALTQKVTSVKLNANTTVYAKWTENAVTPTLPFTDVKSGDWFYEAVQYVYDKGMMTGVSADRFAPASTTTRGMIVTILYRLENEPEVSGGSAFTDVENGAWYADAVAWAAANDIVNGTSATTFAPNSPITREQMAAILYRYAAYKGYDVSQKADLSGYTDAASISDYAKDALAWANAQKLITGVTDTTLNPQGSATRAQVATILMRLCETVVK